ncbi:esterase [Kocuria flava]|uniref:Esterase n=1 Tax=Kocuria flava TaxID=446860 RepID=A0A0U3HQS1_9MICC|nr:MULTISPECIES: alpha/beta fold hydrolase [Kocuria]ALU39846.1 esterase [Kocuria flava]MCD1144144.1 alpha/beta fold hydrolase [Kocuria sp. LUK]PLC13023.1 esterase [Kocuria flava]GEO93762.1 carboxylesterase [Kocuria flava]
MTPPVADHLLPPDPAGEPGALSPAEPFELPAAGPAAALVLHGFTGVPHSVRPWGRALHGAGVHVSGPLLPGHGTRWEDLAGTRWEQWRDHAAAHVRRLRAEHDVVVVCGLSMGGALALHLAALLPVDGVVALNPALSVVSRTARLAPALHRLVPSVPAVGDDISLPGVTEHAYPRTPVAGVAQLGRFMVRTRRLLPSVTVPVLVLRSRADGVVSDRSHEHVLRSVGGSVELVRLDGSRHVATLDRDADVVHARSERFVADLVAGTDPVTGRPLSGAGPVDRAGPVAGGAR